MPRAARPLRNTVVSGRGLLVRPVLPVLSVVLAFLAFGAGSVACGPSYQAIHEGDARFEHCYAIDEGAAASMDDKSRCWHDYRENFTFGQARDRLTYAARREHLLARSQALPTDEAMMEAAPGQVNVVTNAPAPTNAFVPPPQMLQQPSVAPLAPTSPSLGTIPSRADGGVMPVTALQNLPLEAPGAPCASRCTEAWHACEKSCVVSKGPAVTPSSHPASAASAGSSHPASAACDRCDKTHRTCMAACFR
jgi:hypothetical protein